MFDLTLSKALPTTPTRTSTDGMKGLLILLVIFGHAGNFWADAPAVIVIIKYFHVACFLLLPFIYPIQECSWAFIRDRLARYYIPFAFFSLIYGGLFFLTLHQGSLTDWVRLLPPALLIANAPQIDAATGMQALWFLPALITAVLSVAFFIGRLKTNGYILVGCAIAAHSCIGLLDQPTKEALPFGIANVAYLFFLGCVIRLICLNFSFARLQKGWMIWAGLFLLSAVASNITGAHIKFPVMYLPSIAVPFDMLIQDILIVSAFMTLLLNPYLCLSNTLQYLGKKSLGIYLMHLPFVFAAYLAAQSFISPQMSALSMVAVCGMFLFALAGAVICVIISERFSILSRLIFPKDWKSFRSAREGL